MRGVRMVKSKQTHLAGNEQGFVLVVALACLVVLSLIGIAAMNTSNIEKNIAQNINLAEKTFYGADGGTEVGIEMIEFNLSWDIGFTNAGLSDTNPNPNLFYNIQGLQITDPLFARRTDYKEIPWNPVMAGFLPGTAIDAAFPTTANFVPSDGARSIRIPENMALQNDFVPHTNLAFIPTLSEGGEAMSPHQLEGYGGGPGRSPADRGGAFHSYQVLSQKIGLSNSEAVINLGWDHQIGSEGNPRPY